MATELASITEIFSSVQGEGLHVGERQIFVRFENCNIRCEYCDELGKPGSDWAIDSTVERIKELERNFGPHPFVSLTGGEPLLYVPFLKLLLPRLKEEGFQIYLETNGILHLALREVLKWLEVVAMDVKPPSVTKGKSFLLEHHAFLKMATEADGRKRETFVKMVCSKDIDEREFYTYCEMIASEGQNIPLVLQPMTLGREVREDPVLMARLEELQVGASRILKNVRIIPRIHKILNLR